MKNIYKIKGMHCRSCEVLIENEVRKISGVKAAHASTKKGQLLVVSEDDLSAEVTAAVKEVGYEIGFDNAPLINKNKKSYYELIPAIIIVAVLFFLFRSFDLTSLLNPASFASSNLAAIFTIGLTAGVSSCMALVGGLVLGISARYAEKHPNAGTLKKFRPHLFFNLGRISSFFLLGGLMGAAGSFLRISGVALGIMTVIVAVVMLLLGLQLTEIFPKISSVTLPKFLSGFQSKKDKEYSHTNSMLLGALTFFLPCGFTQTAQIYAISTGSFIRGALVMSFFALGTTPGLLAVGGLTSAIKKGTFSRIMFKTIGVIIILLAFYNLRNGLNLAGFRIPDKEDVQTNENMRIWGPSVPGPGSNSGEVQVLKAVYDPPNDGAQYVIEPHDFTVKVNQPARLEVLAKIDGQGCMGSITLPGLTSEFKLFTKDETAIFEFTPKKVKTYQITCGMGIPMGTINVIK